jgi:predicted ester cyclase
MSVKENKKLIHPLYNLYNRHELDACNELFSSDRVGHLSDIEITLEENKQFDVKMLAAFPDLNITLHNMIAEGDKVAFQVHLKATHTGAFMGAPPTGMKVDITNTHIVQIIGNKIVNWWGTTEFPRLMQQLRVTSDQSMN